MALVPQAHTFENPKEVDEETLIKSRLTTVEVKTINRVQKRCNTIITSENLFTDALSARNLSSTLSKDDANVEMADVAAADGAAPAEATDLKPVDSTPQERIESAAERLVEEILLDFAPLEEALMRIQLLTAANRKEVARYEQKKMQIEHASEKARTEMVELNASLSEAHQLKQHKLEYDVIATEITSSPNSQKTRQAQYDSINRLNSEIEALEREKAEYGKVWAARRAQFGAIVEALMGMQAQIQEDKEEQERREGLDDDEDEGEKPLENGEKDGGKVEGANEAAGSTQEASGSASKNEDLTAENKGDAGDVAMEDTQLEEGERISTRDQSRLTSPRLEEGEEVEEGEELEGTVGERSVAPTPGPQDGSYEEMETDDRPPDDDNDMDDDEDDDGAIDESEEGDTSQGPKTPAT
ncbi:hypothetical protein H072_1973 [Dactylellina haptotyla CBS 200.50]|uniref:Tho complex subunit 7/Mft1p n=1 Tax=Dactylellina haptotyla (strain CBS 200.50) TaxID=1284197 RepID=S8BX31_DACHA|nr:hypothetical protein H072_1973 [Dactylellina haptotyla CBS 200.50]